MTLNRVILINHENLLVEEGRPTLSKFELGGLVCLSETRNSQDRTRNPEPETPNPTPLPPHEIQFQSGAQGSENGRVARGSPGAKSPEPNTGLSATIRRAHGGAQGSEKRRPPLGRSGAERPEAREVFGGF